MFFQLARPGITELAVNSSVSVETVVFATASEGASARAGMANAVRKKVKQGNSVLTAYFQREGGHQLSGSNGHCNTKDVDKNWSDACLILFYVLCIL